MPPKGSKRKPVDPLKVIADLETKCTDLMNRENVGEFADVLADSLKALWRQAKTHQIKEISDNNDDDDDDDDDDDRMSSTKDSKSSLDEELTEKLRDWIVAGKNKKTDKMFFQLAENCEFHLTTDNWHDQTEITKSARLLNNRLSYIETYNGYKDMVGSDEGCQEIGYFFEDPQTKKLVSLTTQYGDCNNDYDKELKEIFEACAFGKGVTFEQFSDFFDHLYGYLMDTWNRSSFSKRW